jgi:hypothetical protein
MPLPSEIDRHARDANRGFARAAALSRGLIMTGRARRAAAAAADDGLSEFTRLERRTAAGSYWVHRDGSEVRAGISFAAADPLQPGFVDAMARAGAAAK